MDDYGLIDIALKGFSFKNQPHGGDSCGAFKCQYYLIGDYLYSERRDINET